IIDSTPERHPELGEAFHLYIPYLIYYGYEDTRHGEVYVVDGTYFNLRAFALPYGDYRGPFRDNPYELRVIQKPLEGPPEENYMKDTIDAFNEITKSGGGDLVYSTGPEDLVDRIRGLLEREKNKEVDIVLCLDTTSSMKDDIDEVRKALIPMLKDTIAEFKSFRIGMVLYKDYFEDYLNRVVSFTSDFNQFQRLLNGIRVGGGRDIPEAVYEALYEGAVKFPWQAESRIMILIGDAPPHPRQRGKISKEMVDREVGNRNIKVSAIILPQ
ncbi:MAG: VWA domain-containing protein, partial [Treponema sp.]|nr:VWA domain-containing protein [Treponema sp.]